MSEQQHMQGPWKLCYDGAIESADGLIVANLPFGSYKEFNDSAESVKANYRLMASAPALLAALKALNALVVEEVADGEYTEQSIKARAAIADATGQ